VIVISVYVPVGILVGASMTPLLLITISPEVCAEDFQYIVPAPPLFPEGALPPFADAVPVKPVLSV
jgi:hypothetical protein